MRHCAKPLFEARSGEWGVGQIGGCFFFLFGRKCKSGNAKRTSEAHQNPYFVKLYCI